MFFIGMIGVFFKEESIVVKWGSCLLVVEMFWLLWMNLNYLLGGDEIDKIMLVIFSIFGEGKSFIIINLGMFEAFVGKKIILFGFDFRKLKLVCYLIGEI